MNASKVYDLIGIGIGPFNLGLAALCENIEGLKCLFIDERKEFSWHPGLLLPQARLQVPYYADLVSLADPCSRFSYLCYLKATNQFFRFAIAEKYFIKRTEYNAYCRWVADQLKSLRFDCCCQEIVYDEDQNLYEVVSMNDRFYARHLVIGIGTKPYVPEFAHTNHPGISHSSDYLYKKEDLLTKRRITIVGSGQSAAEIFYDLLDSYKGELWWFTKSERFSPMDYSKFALEMTSPDYIDHFYSLPPSTKENVLSKQSSLYKGINFSLIDDIYQLLVEKNSRNVHLHPNCALKNVQVVNDAMLLQLAHQELDSNFTHQTDALVLATGYAHYLPSFIKHIENKIQWLPGGKYNVNRNYSIDQDHTIFVQNADLHSHGFNSADLGMGPYRNAIILNSILGHEYFPMEKNVSFQNFGLPYFKELA